MNIVDHEHHEGPARPTTFSPEQERALREELGRDLAERMDHRDKVLLALHTGCGAIALGVSTVSPMER